jgi:hypothetical protein
MACVPGSEAVFGFGGLSRVVDKAGLGSSLGAGDRSTVDDVVLNQVSV